MAHKSASSESISKFRILRMLLVIILWLLPALLIWQIVRSDSESIWQSGLADWQLASLSWYPLIAVLMLFFAPILYRRLPPSSLGLSLYIVSAVLMPIVHWWWSGVDSLSLLFAEGATVSLTVFVLGFSLELFRRIAAAALRGSWWLAIAGGLANILLFVAPGVLIAVTLYDLLFQNGLFSGGLFKQIPYLVFLVAAVWHERDAFRTM